MDGIKGVGRTVAVCETDNHRLELELYPDESWGIRRQGERIGVWEPHEKDDCFRIFGMLAGLDEPSSEPHLIVLAPRGSVEGLSSRAELN
jgi:hypothetical protein